ncbi:MAG: hypothetical protein COU85_01950 [Candidatus Portnoybacteria bacterium CG10_big_fil_rev_8_21_14_0_10_44_7]|uniref:Uncharacterized protein n=1 Tax=Candidatus Portnoybacteria bacterium CG10_big_fil_rev_8_21_14_0_10_44_7 TaxID=1974816 RepID=A0A2M8KIK8_9BACT|nr:MAG: hypothetical protein COU85_01950 [Candidatus Portnoybacteria bacterium CG10_big_fil_rev_8_21_14_0_10_44_7]
MLVGPATLFWSPDLVFWWRTEILHQRHQAVKEGPENSFAEHPLGKGLQGVVDGLQLTLKSFGKKNKYHDFLLLIFLILYHLSQKKSRFLIIF